MAIVMRGEALEGEESARVALEACQAELAASQAETKECEAELKAAQNKLDVERAANVEFQTRMVNELAALRAAFEAKEAGEEDDSADDAVDTEAIIAAITARLPAPAAAKVAGGFEAIVVERDGNGAARRWVIKPR